MEIVRTQQEGRKMTGFKRVRHVMRLRKEQRCYWCNAQLLKGEPALYYSSKTSGGFEAKYVCFDCDWLPFVAVGEDFPDLPATSTESVKVDTESGWTSRPVTRTHQTRDGFFARIWRRLTGKAAKLAVWGD